MVVHEASLLVRGVRLMMSGFVCMVKLLVHGVRLMVRRVTLVVRRLRLVVRRVGLDETVVSSSIQRFRHVCAKPERALLIVHDARHVHRQCWIRRPGGCGGGRVGQRRGRCNFLSSCRGCGRCVGRRNSHV